jgi:hypothetical protein
MKIPNHRIRWSNENMDSNNNKLIKK